MSRRPRRIRNLIREYIEQEEQIQQLAKAKQEVFIERQPRTAWYAQSTLGSNTSFGGTATTDSSNAVPLSSWQTEVKWIKDHMNPDQFSY